MSIIGGLDVHRRQITYDWVDHNSGKARRGRIAPATREVLRGWLGELPCPDGAFAVEGCTGWRFVLRSSRRPGWSRTWPNEVPRFLGGLVFWHR